MSDEKRTILEMLAEGRITQEQADQLLEALGDSDEAEAEIEAEPTEETTPSITVNDADGSATIYPDGTIELQGDSTGEPMVINGGNHQINLTLHPDHAEINLDHGEPSGINVELPHELIPPAPPAPPEPPQPPQPGSQEDMERYIQECQENNQRYCQEMNKYQQQMAQYAAQLEKSRLQASPQPEAPAPTTGSWSSWLSGIGEELRQGLREIGRELGRDLDNAMDDVSDAISDMKDALGDVVEDWQEELAEEQEELAEQMEEAAELAEENSFLSFGPNFPFGEEDVRPGDVEQVIHPDNKPEYENGQFVYRKWAGLNEIEKLEINWPTGLVSVHPWDGDSVEAVEYSKKALPPEQRCLIFVQDAKRLIIREYPQQKNSGSPFGKGWSNMGKLSKRLEVLIPRDKCGQVEKLEIKAMSSSVHVSGLSGETYMVSAVSGSVNLESISVENLDAGTVSGSINLAGVSAEKLNAHSVSGSNHCNGFDSEKALLSTVSGSLKAHGNAEKFKISTVSGTASLSVDQCPVKAEMSSVSGSLKIYLPENSGFTADYSSTSGSFGCDFDVSVKADGKRKKNGRATYGNGVCKIDMHTTSGSMSVLRSE